MRRIVFPLIREIGNILESWERIIKGEEERSYISGSIPYIAPTDNDEENTDES